MCHSNPRDNRFCYVFMKTVVFVFYGVTVLFKRHYLNCNKIYVEALNLLKLLFE